MTGQVTVDPNPTNHVRKNVRGSRIVQIQHSGISANQTAVMETGPDRWQRNAQVGARSWQDGQRFLQGQNEGQVRQNIQRLSTDSELRTARDLTRM